MNNEDPAYREIDKSGLFSVAWYLAQYQDVAAANQDPLEHYLLYGVSEDRDPGPDFSTTGYLARYHDVADAGINPLLHYIRYGKKEGRLTTPCLDPDLIKRPYRNFDEYLTTSMLDPLVKAPFATVDLDNFKLMNQVSRWLCNKQKDSEDPPLVSIIMPVRDRAGLLGEAIRSVLEQTYENFELIVVDDGSGDDSVSVVRSFADPRIRIFEHPEPTGVSATRNRGLQKARGDLIAYLDSDNTWKPDYLSAMAGLFQVKPDADAAYCGQYLFRGCEKEPFAVRFASYHRSLLFNRNYIDLNCFVHRHSILETIGGGFCEKINRWVDWEVILRIVRVGKIYAVPVLLSNYYLDKASNTISEIMDVQPARDYILSKTLSWNQYGSQERHGQLTRKVAVLVTRSDDPERINNCLASFHETSEDPLAQVIPVDKSIGKDSAAESCINTASTKSVAVDNVSHFLNGAARSLDLAGPDCDLLIMDPKAKLAAGALPAMQHAAHARESIAMVAPQRILPGGHPEINVHVPYAFEDVPCDVTLSHRLRNVEKVPLFYDGGVIELNHTSFFCVYIKRAAWDLCCALGHWPSDPDQCARTLCDFIRHVLDKKIVYTPDAVVLQMNDSSIRNDSPAPW